MTNIARSAQSAQQAPRHPSALLAELPEQELLARMLDNDRRAWQAFERRYRRLLTVTIRRVLLRFGSVHGVDFDDVYSTLLTSLVANDMRKLRMFDFGRNLKFVNWLALLACRAAWDHLRDLRRQSDLLQNLRHTECLPLDQDPARLMVVREQCERTVELCRTLNVRDRRFVEMFYVQGASSEEIAAALGISVKTVYTKNFKIRLKLSPALEGPVQRTRPVPHTRASGRDVSVRNLQESLAI